MYKHGDILKAPPGKGFKIFRGDGAYMDLRTGKIMYSRFKMGKPLRLSRKESFSTSKKIAEEFAYGIAEHYGKPYVPVIITVLANRIVIGLFWDLEREVYVRGKNKVIDIEVL